MTPPDDVSTRLAEIRERTSAAVEAVREEFGCWCSGEPHDYACPMAMAEHLADLPDEDRAAGRREEVKRSLEAHLTQAKAVSRIRQRAEEMDDTDLIYVLRNVEQVSVNERAEGRPRMKATLWIKVGGDDQKFTGGGFTQGAAVVDAVEKIWGEVEADD